MAFSTVSQPAALHPVLRDATSDWTDCQTLPKSRYATLLSAPCAPISGPRAAVSPASTAGMKVLSTMLRGNQEPLNGIHGIFFRPAPRAWNYPERRLSLRTEVNENRAREKTTKTNPYALKKEWKGRRVKRFEAGESERD